MMKMMVIAALLTGAAAAGAAERLRGYDALAATTERVAVRGIGIGRSGHFTLGGASGSYQRFAERARVRGETYARAGVRFTVGDVAGQCLADEASYRDRLTRNLAMTTTAVPYGIECRFTVGGRPAGVLNMDSVPARGVSAADTRRGSLQWGEAGMGVRSVHHFARSPLPAGAPLGYLIERRGGAVAGVDVSGVRPVLLLPRADVHDGTRDAALAATVALALMWEPDAG